MSKFKLPFKKLEISGKISWKHYIFQNGENSFENVAEHLSNSADEFLLNLFNFKKKNTQKCVFKVDKFQLNQREAFL